MARTLDFASDWAVLAYAVWTLIAYCGMATGAKATLLVFVWLATVPLGGAALFALSRRSESQSAPEPAAPPTAGAFARRSRRRLLAASLVAGLASAFVAAVASSAPWIVVWAGTAVAVAVAVGMRGLRVEESNDPAPAFAWPAHVFAAVAGLAFATMSLFIRKPNADDVFYVNRATGTAELNRIPVRDIIFTEERVPPVSGTGLPVDTFSALQGALARAADVHAASVAYYVTPPLATFLATWALWRLLRLWAPRHAVLCFALGCAYWVLSAQPSAGASRLAAGSFFLTRMWQGKVVFTAWLVLTLYVFLTRWVGKRDGLIGVLLVAAGVASIGMTGSAAFVVPLVFAAAAVALVPSRAWRGLPVLAGAAAFPFVVGLVATRKYPLTPIFEEGLVRKLPPGYLTTAWSFHDVYGVGVIAALGLIALWAAPWLARPGPAAHIVSGIAVVSALLLAPAVVPALDDLTGLSTLLRRTLWIAPLPALVGLLAALPVAHLLRRVARVPALLRGSAAAAPALLVAGALVVFGHPLWISSKGDSMWSQRPTWKIPPHALADAQEILRRYRGSGPILAEPRVMHAIALITVGPKTVNPRSFFARLTPEPREQTRNRLALTRFVALDKPQPSRERVRRALSDLRVGLVCVDATNRPVIDEIERIGNYRWAFRVGTDEPEDAHLDPRRGRLLQGGICFVRKLQE